MCVHIYIIHIHTHTHRFSSHISIYTCVYIHVYIYMYTHIHVAALFRRFVQMLAEIQDAIEVETSAAETWLRMTERAKAASSTAI